MELNKVTEVQAIPDFATTEINKALKNGWVILNISQYTHQSEGDAHGLVLLGKLSD